MDIKVEIEDINLICHGCLATDRKLRRIQGEFRKMFQFLRNDDKTDVQSRELLLCWECVEFLKKFEMFRTKIRKAEYLLVRYIQNYYNEDGYTNSQCLSSLKTTHIYTYTYKYYAEEKSLHEIANNDSIEPKEKGDRLEIEVVADIKMESNDIKGEQNYSNNIVTGLKIEKDNNIEKSTKFQKKIVKKKYEKTTVTSGNDNDTDYSDTEFKIQKDNNTDKYSSVKKKIVKKKTEKTTATKSSNDDDSDHNNTELKIERDDNVEKSSKVQKKINKKNCEKTTVTKSSNDNDSDYSDTEFKIEKDNNIEKHSKVKKKSINTSNRYKKFASITKRDDIVTNNYSKYIESVCLDQKEYENVLKKDYGYRIKNQRFKCNKCQQLFFTNLDLLRHITFQHNEQTTFPYKCAACTTMITSKEHLDAHWTESHTKMLKCTLCSRVYHIMSEIKRHLYKEHTKNYSCKECGLELGNLPEFKKHYKVMHEAVICDYCKASFTQKKYLLCHMRRQHIPASCKLCDRTYRNHTTLKNHNIATHPELISGETRKELSYCVECDKQYPSVHSYQRHLTFSPRHKPRIRVPCPECGKTFFKTYLDEHFRLFHLKVTKNYCKECDKYYAGRGGLKQHIARFHKKIPLPKNKYCDICGRGFSMTKTLQNHRRTHTGERPYKCSFCPAAFAQRSAMNTHQKSQHKNLDLPS